MPPVGIGADSYYSAVWAWTEINSGNWEKVLLGGGGGYTSG